MPQLAEYYYNTRTLLLQREKKVDFQLGHMASATGHFNNPTPCPSKNITKEKKRKKKTSLLALFKVKAKNNNNKEAQPIIYVYRKCESPIKS